MPNDAGKQKKWHYCSILLSSIFLPFLKLRQLSWARARWLLAPSYYSGHHCRRRVVWDHTLLSRLKIFLWLSLAATKVVSDSHFFAVTWKRWCALTCQAHEILNLNDYHLNLEIPTFFIKEGNKTGVVGPNTVRSSVVFLEVREVRFWRTNLRFGKFGDRFEARTNFQLSLVSSAYPSGPCCICNRSRIITSLASSARPCGPRCCIWCTSYKFRCSPSGSVHTYSV